MGTPKVVFEKSHLDPQGSFLWDSMIGGPKVVTKKQKSHRDLYIYTFTGRENTFTGRENTFIITCESTLTGRENTFIISCENTFTGRDRGSRHGRGDRANQE